MIRLAVAALVTASPLWADTCATPDDLNAPGLMFVYSDGATEKQLRLPSGYIASEVVDSFGTVAELSRKGLFLIEGVEVNSAGRRSEFSESYELGAFLDAPEPNKTIKTVSDSYSGAEYMGRVSTFWRAGPQEVMDFHGCDHPAYLIEQLNTAMHTGAMPEKRRYVYLPEFGTGILLDVRFQDEPWPALSIPSLRRAEE